MEALLNIVTDGRTTRVYVTLREDEISLMPGERPIDLLMEGLSRIRSTVTEQRVLRELTTLSRHGVSHVAGCMVPGALRHQTCFPGFVPSVDHVIDIEARSETETSFACARISLDGAPSMAFDSGYFITAPEREDAVDLEPVAIFQDGTKRHYDNELRRDQIATGALLTGYISAFFDHQPSYAWEDFHRESANLAVALALAAGHDFRTYENLSNTEWAYSSVRRAFPNFRRFGYLVSDRGWNPRAVLRGPRLEDAKAVADPELLAFGLKIGPSLIGLKAQISRRLTLSILESLDVKMDRIESDLGKMELEPLSNHERIRNEALLGYLMDTAKAAA